MDTKVVRLRGKSRNQATPYLREWLPKLRLPGPPDRCAVDLACGDGRNSEHLKAAGFKVWAFDMKPDYSGAQLRPWRAGEPIPLRATSADLVLCQYMLMFISDSAIALVLDEIERILKKDGYLVIELQPVKQGRPVRLRKIVEYLYAYGRGKAAFEKYETGLWEVINLRKNRCILRKLYR